MPISKHRVSKPELYSNVDREDPTSILNGVAVSGLIGIIRQLGDLAEFAAEIFHGIQEEVMATASRSNQLKIRLQNIEATVPPLEKAVLAQTTHLHFAYTGGLKCHPRIPIEQNHFICDDLPRFIMDPYEDCRDPPRLHLLDKFDINGPGSCLKRYSDPTYFRRVSSNLIQGNNKKFKSNNNKAKKKNSSSRSRDMARLASIANQSARKTFTSFSFSAQTSSSKTASSSDVERRSHPLDHHSHSFSTATSSLRTRETPKEAFVSSSLTRDSCTIASVLSECETENAHDSFQFSPLQREAPCGSSCVSWDEKAEIMESPGLQTDETSEMMVTNSVVDAIDEKSSYGEDKSESRLQQHVGVDEVREIETGLETVREPRDSEHETESEGDSFVDAVNTIEQESENNQGLQTRQEVVSSSCRVTDENLENSVCERSSNSVEDSCRPMDGIMGYGFGNDEKSCGLVERLSSSVNASDEMDHQDPQVSSDINRSPCNDLRSSNISGGEDNTAFTFFPEPEKSLSDSSNHLYNSYLQEHKKTEAETSRDVEAIKIWTNGGLLGLKPSKPPVLAVPSSLSLDSKTDEKDKLDDLVESTSLRGLLSNSSLATSDGKTTIVADQREYREAPPGVFGLSHKLLTNGFYRNVPETIPENSEVCTEKTRFCDQEDTTLMDPMRDEAFIDWFTSSPPLQHMKISLNPVDTFQASRLKLKLSDGDNRNSTFSSFHLLPEAATSLLDSCSEDDDTFCRSSSYMSDTDYHSDNHSLSNSEQWEESSDINERKEQELYDSFRERRHVDNNGEHLSLEIEAESGCVAITHSYLQNPSEPLPPPFPPAQWMISKTDSENKTTQSVQLQDALIFAFENHMSLSTVNKEEPNIATSAPNPEVKVHLKNNVRDNDKETEAGDFLQQIRTQHCNLRHVVTTPTLSTAATTTELTINTKISAILEKANSIRQVVASNDGEESDTWSDT
ncbi:unnamed protein product [Cochlearia groenlandica]